MLLPLPIYRRLVYGLLFFSGGRVGRRVWPRDGQGWAGLGRVGQGWVGRDGQGWAGMGEYGENGKQYSLGCGIVEI